MEQERRDRRVGDRRKEWRRCSSDSCDCCVDRRKGERRKPRKKHTLLWIIGNDTMCRKATTCPKFERRTIDGIKGACEDCEYIRKERRKLWALRIILVAGLAIFLCTTSVKFGDEVDEIEHEVIQHIEAL